MDQSALERAHELGWEYWGPLQCSGELVIADPGYIGSAYAESVDDDVQPNYLVKAQPGTWHVFVRRAPADKAQCADVEVWELCACLEETLTDDLERAYDEADERLSVVLDSGKACVIDASRRDDSEFRENVFWAKEGESVEDAGYTTLAGTDGGVCPVFVRGDSAADLVVIVFEWEEDDEDDDD